MFMEVIWHRPATRNQTPGTRLPSDLPRRSSKSEIGSPLGEGGRQVTLEL